MHQGKIRRLIKAVKRKYPGSGWKKARHLRNMLFTKRQARKGIRDNRKLYR